MEIAGNVTTVRTNLALDPNATSTGDWTNISSTTHGRTVESTIVKSGTTAVRYTLQAAGPLGGKARLSGGVTTGDTVSWSVWVYPSVTMDMQPYWERTSPTYSGSSGGAYVTCPANTWTKISGTYTFDATRADPAGSFGFGVYSGSNSWANGNYFILDEGLIEKVELPALGNFFSGATTSSGDWTYGWNGTTNASSSYQRSVQVASWAARWFGGTGGAGVYWRSAGTGMSGGYSYRKLWTKANTGSAQDTGIDLWGNVVEGATYTASIYQKSSVDQSLSCFIQWIDSADAVISQTSTSAFVATPANVWTRGSVTATAPTGAVKARYIFGPYGNATPMPAGATLDFDWAMVEESPVLRAYQDGTVAAPGDYTYGWAGAANSSASQQKAPPVGGGYTGASAIVHQSSEWAADGSKSMRIVPSAASKDSFSSIPFTLVTGKTYTITAVCRLEGPQTGTPDTRARKIIAFHSGTSHSSSAASNAAGSTTLSVTFTVVDAAVYQSLRLYNGADYGNGDVWYDSLLIEETDVAKPYFNGSTPAAQDMTHVWSGTADASTSLMRVNLPSGMSNSGGRFGIHSTEWSARGTKSVKVTHNYAAAATNTDQFVEFQNMISGGLQANKTYTISGTCRTAATLTGTLNASAMKFMLNINSVSIPITHTSTKPNTPGTARVVGTFTTGNDTNILFLRAMGGASYGNGDVWWDELVLEEGITDGAYFDGYGSSAQNLIPNGSFETDVAGWQGAGLNPPTVVRSTTQAYIGTSSLLASCNGSNPNQGAFTSSNRPVLRPGMVYTASAWVKGNVGTRLAIEMGELDAGTALIGRTQSTAVSATGGWQRISATRAMGANAAFGDMVVRNLDAVANNIYIDGAMIEQASTASPDYYVGFGDYTYAWSGTADASASYRRAPGISSLSGSYNSYITQSVIWPTNLTKSVRITPFNPANTESFFYIIGSWGNLGTMVAGKTYTVSATLKLNAPLTGTLHSRALSISMRENSARTAYVTGTNTAGTQRLSMTFTIGAGTTNGFLEFFNGASMGGGDVWWDDIIVVEGTHGSDYFDGSTAASGDFTYGWTGTAHASTSRQLAPGPSLINSTGTATKAIYLSSERPAAHNKFARMVTYTDNVSVAFNPTDCVIKSGVARTDLLWIRCSRSLTLSLRYRTPDGSGVVGAGNATLVANQWTLLRVFGSPDVGDNAALGPLALSPSLQPGDTLDLGPHMTVEGTYLGDFLDGTKPFSKWDGAMDNSTSVGYPPSLLDIVGNPVVDLSSVGLFSLDDSFSITEPRTIYTVFDALQMPGAGTYPVVTYGVTGLADTVSYQTMMLRMQGTTNASVINRRTGGAGPVKDNVILGARNVSSWGMLEDGKQFVANNNSNIVTNAQIMATPHQSIRIHAPDAYQIHVRTIMFRGYHDASTQAAVSKYLANKHGAAFS
jgi:hypothetical protein